MSFVEGFRTGSDVVGEIQNAILAKKLREINDARYKDETAESRRRFEAELTARNRGLGINETGQQTSADQFNRSLAQERELREKELAARIQEMDAENGIRNKDIAARSRAEQIDQYLRLMDIAGRASKGSNTGSRGGSNPYPHGYQQTTTLDDDSNPIVTKIPLGMDGRPLGGVGMPSQPLSPEAQQIANSIAGLQTKVGKHKVEMAGGDMRTGFLGMGGSRQSQIDEANAKIARLRAMQGEGEQSATVGAAAAPQGQQPAAGQPAQQPAAGGATMIRIRTPQGAVKLIDKNLLQQALQQGATVAQ